MWHELRNNSDKVVVDYERPCECEDRRPIMVNYDMMWHEADIICANCDGFIRYWDAG
jgi:hypothetical protein